MVSIPVRGADLARRFRRLYDDWKVVVAGGEFGGRGFVRVSVQGYNTEADCERLLEALEAVSLN